jgi:hypothetical protein
LLGKHSLIKEEKPIMNCDKMAQRYSDPSNRVQTHALVTYPGVRGLEYDSIVVASRDPEETARSVPGALSFFFYDTVDGKGQHNRSGDFYLNGKVYTLEQVKRGELSDYDNAGTLAARMEREGLDRIFKFNGLGYAPFKEGDQVVQLESASRQARRDQIKS